MAEFYGDEQAKQVCNTIRSHDHAAARFLQRHGIDERRLLRWAASESPAEYAAVAADLEAALVRADLDAERIQREAGMYEAELRQRQEQEKGAASGEVIPSRIDPPAKLLFGWAEILQALGRKNGRTERNRVNSANKRFAGPIRSSGRQGGQPFADQVKLLDWWNRLETNSAEIQEQAQQDKAAREAIRKGRHNFGRDGEVSPEVSGSIKRRRRRK